MVQTHWINQDIQQKVRSDPSFHLINMEVAISRRRLIENLVAICLVIFVLNKAFFVAYAIWAA
jgi:hypothetical protein